MQLRGCHVLHWVVGGLIKRLLRFIYFRKLNLHILTLFLSLLIISSVITLTFSYIKNAQSIFEFSKGTIERVGSTIEEKILCLVNDLEQMPELAAGLLSGYKHITLDNLALTNFMLTAVKAYPNLHAFFVGTPQGDFIEAADLTMITHTHYLFDPSVTLPKGISYALREIDQTKQPPLETWYYMDVSFKTLSQESFPSKFDPRTRPWYMGAQETHQLYWSDVYCYDPTGENGIAVSKPIFNEKGEIIAIVGTDLPLTTFAKFLSQQKIGKTGQAFILNASGKIIIPSNTESSNLVEAAYEQFSKTRQRDFLFEHQGIKYLAYAKPLPVKFKKEWSILIVVPLNDFFGGIFKMRTQAILISIAILALTALAVAFFAKRISKPIVQLTNEIDRIKHLDLESEKRVQSHIQEISLLDSSIASMRLALRSFGRYMPKEIVKQLMEKGKEISIGGEKKEIIVFFSDIADFTPIAESLPIEELMPLLSDYFDLLSKVILESQGTIDKYIGDSVMAFWGAPND
ncbi:MAG TPA: cache domain-containing protein, partial [Waddliaceae bacterium]